MTSQFLWSGAGLPVESVSLNPEDLWGLTVWGQAGWDEDEDEEWEDEEEEWDEDEDEEEWGEEEEEDDDWEEEEDEDWEG